MLNCTVCHSLINAVSDLTAKEQNPLLDQATGLEQQGASSIQGRG